MTAVPHHPDRPHVESSPGEAHTLGGRTRSRADCPNAVRAYRTLMRHRIANPLQVIGGMATTLRDVDDLPPTTRRAMLSAIVDATERLADISCSPAPTDLVEARLQARTGS